MTLSHFSCSTSTASLKSTSGGRADADSIVTETEREIIKYHSTDPVRNPNCAIIS